VRSELATRGLIQIEWARRDEQRGCFRGGGEMNALPLRVGAFGEIVERHLARVLVIGCEGQPIVDDHGRARDPCGTDDGGHTPWEAPFHRGLQTP
jgi:hypothetical protein